MRYQKVDIGDFVTLRQGFAINKKTKPHHHAERMNLQSSVFMIWGANRQPLTDFFSDDDYMVENQPTNSEKGIICHVDISAACKTRLLKQLDSLGINEKFVYPGIEGVGRYIREKYSSKV